MDYLETPSWEYFFNEEALQVEELLLTGQNIDFNSSRVKLALEHKILTWDKYREWCLNTYPHISSLDPKLGPTDILKLAQSHQDLPQALKRDPVWNNELIPVSIWKDQTLALGLEWNEKLATRTDIIFFLTPPHILDQISNENYNENAILTNLAEFEIKHEENTVRARKNFDAYLVLSISNNCTQVYRMDEDLKKENLPSDYFEFSLKEQNPFQESFLNNETKTFQLSDLNLTILDFTHATVTPLKRGHALIGFLLGLKTSHCQNEDEKALEIISKTG